MGWTFPHGALTLREVQALIKSDLQSLQHTKVVDSATTGGGRRMWFVMEVTEPHADKPEQAGKRFIMLYLLSAEGGHGYGYKDMDESVGPFYHDCPLRLLDVAEPMHGASDWALKWRAAVREHHATAKQRKQIRASLAPGMSCYHEGNGKTYRLSYKYSARQWAAYDADGKLWRVGTRHLKPLEATAA